ncbi:uncharacterized protein LOC135840963 [Planococcus citri]|uniref:uncharacterized protein LOC135840963 n=1 Tax=Planococcus citri TaxID=170843 RepID=UPI0031F79A01
MYAKLKIPMLQILICVVIAAAEEKVQNIYNYEPTPIPMPSLYNGYRINPMARATPTSALDQKFHPLTELFPDSQIYYYRMPVVTPYVYVSEFGNYVDNSQPFLSFAPSSIPIQLPVSFLANGKPTRIHTFASDPKPKPEVKPVENQNSNIFNLNKGPYFLNGKPSDLYLLQDTFNPFNGNPLNSFYP